MVHLMIAKSGITYPIKQMAGKRPHFQATSERNLTTAECV